MDEARIYASEPIKALANIRSLFEKQIKEAHKLIMKGLSADNNELVVRMDVALFAVEQSHAEIDKIDNYFAKLFNETQDTIVQYTKTAKNYDDEKRKSEAEAYINLANYKNNIIRLAVVEYLKERRLMFSTSEKLFKDIRKLKELLRF
uniref:Uncharacterized protein n=1 Tax=Meloidogyne incognita TaxID=6306 RepID=A0A914L4P8_MELIC